MALPKNTCDLLERQDNKYQMRTDIELKIHKMLVTRIFVASRMNDKERSK